MSRTLLILSADDVRRALPMTRCIEAMRAAMLAVSERSLVIPDRLFLRLFDGSGVLALMPGSASQPAVYGAKVVSVHPKNPDAGRPSVHGLICMFDHATGELRAILDGAEVTAIRTAAASGLATATLARADARTHGVLGTGAQALTHVEAICAARSSVRRTLVWGRNPRRASAVIDAVAGRVQGEVILVEDPAEAAACDIVSMVTAATTPVLQGAWLRPGAHVNLVGPHRANEREADTETILRSSIWVDQRESAAREAGDLLIPVGEGQFSLERIVGEIGDVIAGRARGRESDAEITLYKSLGIVAQDLYASAAACEAALAQGLGQRVSF